MRISMLKTCCTAAALVLGLTLPAAAQQPSRPISGGDNQTMLVGLGLSLLDAGDNTGVGGGVNVLFNALTSGNTGRLGIVGDFGINDNDFGTVTTFMGGPRFTFNTSGKVSPYGQFLVGIVHCCGDNEFEPAIGGGVDIAWTPQVNFRAELQFFLGDSDAVRYFFGVSLPINKR